MNVPEKMFLKVQKIDTEKVYENCIFMHPKEFKKGHYLEVQAGRSRSQNFLFAVKSDESIAPGSMGVGKPHRDWAALMVETQKYSCQFKQQQTYEPIDKMQFNVELYSKKARQDMEINTDNLASFVRGVLSNTNCPVIDKQTFVMKFESMQLRLTASDLPDLRVYQFNRDTKVVFQNAPCSQLKLKGSARGKKARGDIINPNFNFAEVGIGGLDEQFKAIFRRAFASRTLSPDECERMGIKHIKGMLLYGPPGCGKTLTARQIGKMLSAREPKVVNGPEILNKFVGESESNIRKLFEDAEEEQKRLGNSSGLHIIIFDEIDAICKQRGSVGGGSGVHDTVVNQLLSKIDGVEPLNNILVIGMTNRPDLIDDALLRPGRLEMKQEVGLPDEQGRLAILLIHCKQMIENNVLAGDVDLEEIAKLTKNFSGAEISGLVRAASSNAIMKSLKVDKGVEVNHEAVDQIQVTRDNFMSALEKDIKPAYGHKEEDFEGYMRNGVHIWDEGVQQILDDVNVLTKQIERVGSKTSKLSILLHGKIGTGKTALAVKMALRSDFPFIKIISTDRMIGMSDNAKCNYIKKTFDDAVKSNLSCVVLDDIERLIDYNPVGERYSNPMVQTIMNYLSNTPPSGKKMLVIGTTSCEDFLERMGLDKKFGMCRHVPCIMNVEQVEKVLNLLSNTFTDKERKEIRSLTSGHSLMVGVKKLIQVIDTSESYEDGSRSQMFVQLLQSECELRKD